MHYQYIHPHIYFKGICTPYNNNNHKSFWGSIKDTWFGDSTSIRNDFKTKPASFRVVSSLSSAAAS